MRRNSILSTTKMLVRDNREKAKTPEDKSDAPVREYAGVPHTELLVENHKIVEK